MPDPKDKKTTVDEPRDKRTGDDQGQEGSDKSQPLKDNERDSRAGETEYPS